MAVWARCLTGRQTVNELPCPGVLFTDISPPWASTMRRTIANPSPEPGRPPGLFLTRANSSKIMAWCSGAMPIPVSLTHTSTRPASSTLAAIETIPSESVYLSALLDQVYENLLDPLRIDFDRRQRSVDTQLEIQAAALGLGFKSLVTDCRDCSRSNDVNCKCIFPACICDKSSIEFTNA